MNEILNKLYAQFLFQQVRLEEFLEMRRHINNVSDNELGQEMKEVWNSEHVLPKLPEIRKQQIRTDLYFSIKNERQKYERIFWIKTIAAAAVVILVVNLSWLAWRYNDITDQTFLVEVSQGDRASFILPDESKILLNAESSLSYNTTKTGVREVALTGEAYFQVTKDKSHPFIVKTGDVSIEVLGTSFNVSSYEEDEIIEVSLVEGSIQLRVPGMTTSNLLKPSQKAIYNKRENTVKIIASDNEYETAWTQNKLVFNSERLADVIGKIERWYGVKISLQLPDIAEDRISGSFKNEQITNVMEALKIQYKFNYSIHGNEITIKQ